MSQQIKHLNDDNVRTILKWINLSASIDKSIDDLNIRTDAVFSSKKVSELTQDVKDSLEQYIQSSINGLTHLKKKIVDTLPSDADAEENILYLVKDTSVADAVVYNQYVLIDGVLEPLGNTSTDMSNYYNKDQSDAKFALLSNLQTLIDMVGNASDLETTAKDTLVSAINEIKEGLDNCITKDAIVTTLDDTVTDEQVASALLTKTELDKTNAKLGDKADKSYVDDNFATMDKVTKFPDWSNQLKIKEREITLDQDVYIEVSQLNSEPIGDLKINGKDVSISDFSNGIHSTKFNGYVKKGSVVSYPYLTYEKFVRVFPLV